MGRQLEKRITFLLLIPRRVRHRRFGSGSFALFMLTCLSPVLTFSDLFLFGVIPIPLRSTSKSSF